MDDCSSGYASMSNLTKGQMGKKRIGAGARQRRCDKYRAHMNAIFEMKHLAALDRFKQHLDTDKYRNEMHDIAAGIRENESHLDAACEIKEDLCVGDELKIIKSTDTNTSTASNDILSAKFKIEHATEVNVDHCIHQQVESIIPSADCLSEPLEYTVELNTPYQPQSPSYEPIEDDEAPEVIVIDNSQQICVDATTSAVILHPQKYSVVVLTMEQHPLMSDLDSFIDNVPLSTKVLLKNKKEPSVKEKTLDKFIPRSGCVFRTSSVATAIYLHKRNVNVIAHVNPIALQKAYGHYHDIRKLRRNGVLTFVSSNRLQHDCLICYDRDCLQHHRYFKKVDKQKGEKVNERSDSSPVQKEYQRTRGTKQFLYDEKCDFKGGTE